MATEKGKKAPAKKKDESVSSTGTSPDISHFSLSNGLEVVVIPDHRVPVVTHMIWYRNGSADDPISRSGIAHFLEHLMFKGTKKHPIGEFSNVVSALGGQENAFTSYDYTAYFQRIPKQHLAVMMEYESDRMRNLILRDDMIISERNVVMEERRMRTDTNPSAQLSEAMSATLFTHHPYGIPIIGWMHEIETLKRKDAEDYYKRFYTPENAILVISGDVTEGEVRKLVKTTYAKIKGQGSRPVRERPQEPPSLTARFLSLADPKVEQPMLTRNYLVPSVKTAQKNDSYALDVLCEILGGGTTSYLYKNLVVDKKVAVSTGCWYMSDALDQSFFSLYGVPASGTSPEGLEKELDIVLTDAKNKAFTDSAIEGAKTRLIAQTIYARDSQSSMARIYGAALSIDLTIEDVDKWPERIEAVTREEIISALDSYLISKRSVTGYLLKS